MRRPDPAEEFLFPVASPTATKAGRLRAGIRNSRGDRRQANLDGRESLSRYFRSTLGFALVLTVAVMFLSSRAASLMTGSAWDPMAVHATGLLDASAALALLAMVVGTAGIVRRPPSRPRFPVEDKVVDWVSYGLICVVGAFSLFVWQNGRWYAEEMTHAGEQETKLPLVRVLPDRSGIISGSQVNKGMAELITHLLDANPTARTLHLFGPGGSETEARAVVGVIRARGLDTVVRGGCYSACTMMFAAGRTRTFLTSVDGFKPLLGYHGTGLHSPTGIASADIGPLRKEYLALGLEPGFVERAVTTPHGEIWKPSLDELLAGNAVTAVAGPYDHIGLRWLRPTVMMRDDPPFGATWIASVLSVHAPDVLSDVRAWTKRAWGMGRNERRTDDLRRSAYSRVFADAVSKASDADVRKAGAYLVAGMSKARMTSNVACARMGARTDFVAASEAVPSPPGSASDPTDPWGALMGRAFGAAVHRGWPAGIALLDDADPATWAVRHASPAPRESCGDLVRWYEAATDLADVGGPSRLRERFARAALVPADGDDLTGVGRHDHETLAHLGEAEARAPR